MSMERDKKMPAGRKVLCIMYHFPPLGGVPVLRSLRIARYLPDLSWEPIVITSSSGFDAIHGADDILLDKVPKNLKVIRALDPLGRLLSRLHASLPLPLWRLLDRVSKLIFFPDEKIWWGVLALWQARQIVKRTEGIHAIYATGFPWTSFLVAVFLKRIIRRPLILDFRDAWSLSPGPLWRRFKLHGLLERNLLKNADRLVFCTKTLRNSYRDKYPDLAESMVTIYNGYDPGDFAVERRYLPNARAKKTGKLILCYTGSLSDSVPGKPHSQSLAPFLQAYAALRSQSPGLYDRLTIDIYSNEVPETRTLAENLGLDSRVQFHTRVPHDEVLEIVARSDGLLLILMRGAMGRHIIPAKLYEYLASGKPILTIAPRGSEAAELVQQQGLGVVVDYENMLENLPAALYSLLFTSTWQRNGARDRAMRSFNGQNLVAELAEILDELATIESRIG